MWRWTASAKYFTRPASCGPQVGCYKREKILHQKIWTGNKKHFLKIPSERAIIWTDKCNTYKDSSFITHMLNADMAILSQTVTDTIQHTSTRERLCGDMPRARLSTMYNCATCLLPCLFKTSGNACNNTNKMKGQLKPSLGYVLQCVSRSNSGLHAQNFTWNASFFVKCNCTSHIIHLVFKYIMSRLAKNLGILVI